MGGQCSKKCRNNSRVSFFILGRLVLLEDLEPDTDEDIIDVTDYSERPSNDKRSPRPKQTDLTQGHCPHLKTAHICGHECFSSGTY